MFSVTAQMWTWASVSPGISVAPRRSSVVTRPGRAPTRPSGSTSRMRSSSTTTAAPSTGSAPVQSIRNALVKTLRLIAWRAYTTAPAAETRWGIGGAPRLGRGAPKQLEIQRDAGVQAVGSEVRALELEGRAGRADEIRRIVQADGRALRR